METLRTDFHFCAFGGNGERSTICTASRPLRVGGVHHVYGEYELDDSSVLMETQQPRSDHEEDEPHKRVISVLETHSMVAAF